MRIKDLVEATEKHVTFCFGRMNPPTVGHKEVFKAMERVGGDFKIFLTQTQDKKENPLSYEEKIEFLKDLCPQYAKNIVENRSLNTIGKVASFLYEQGYKHATFVAGDDRLESLGKVLRDYNGVEGKAHGYYKFETLDLKSSGPREDGAAGVTGVSASKAREKAAEGDLKGFAEKTGAGQYAEEMFNAVRQGLGINMKASDLVRESKTLPAEKPRNFVAKNAKMGGAGAHKDKKKAAKQGDVKHKQKVVDEETVNELSNEKLGQYKTAAGAQASAADKAGNYEKGNKRFKGIVKATKKQFANDTKVKESIEDRLAARVQQYLK